MLLYKVNFKSCLDVLNKQEHTLIIDIPNFVENSKDSLEKEGLIQSLVEKQIKQRIEWFQYEPFTTEQNL